jgi:GNAT superfamily N-acetyltransferase
MIAEQTSIIRDLGDGLVLRHGRTSDTEELAAFNAFIFRNHDTGEPNEYLSWWTRDLIARHPTVRASDFTVVEDTRTHKIVSSFVWISQRWSYGGIQFGVGRPEMVGTHPDYRNRGVIRAQFDVAHQWSTQRGELLQAITGIPYFYRQFGYEMTMQLGAGRSGYKPQVPALKKDQAEPYMLRPTTLDDLPFIMDLYALRARRYLVDCVRDEMMWQFEVAGKSEKNVTRGESRIIQTPEGRPVGVLGYAGAQSGQTVSAQLYELKPDVSWVDVSPSVIRYLWATGEANNVREKKDGLSEFRFELGLEHPFYRAMKDHLPNANRPYAWYIRVPDIVAFLRCIAPVLERNLAGSVAVGHTGELKLSAYRSGVKLVFDKGHISAIEPWKPTADDGGNAAFPGYTFLQVLFGYRSLDELRDAFPDCWVGGNAMRALVDALFPRHESSVWPVS